MIDSAETLLRLQQLHDVLVDVLILAGAAAYLFLFRIIAGCR